MHLDIQGKRIVIFSCTTLFRRFLGLMGKKDFDYGLCFPRCNSIHSFFMRENISVIMTDRSHHILYLYRSLKPWKVILPKRNVYYVYELPICDLSMFQVGDVLLVNQDKKNTCI